MQNTLLINHNAAFFKFVYEANHLDAAFNALKRMVSILEGHLSIGQKGNKIINLFSVMFQNP